MDKGFVILAVNNSVTNYVKCAEVLAHSIRHCMPDSNISLITDSDYHSEVFDNVIMLPYGNVSHSDWKLSNDWQVYESSPYEYTIKLEADMYIPRSIDHWWHILQDKDVHICNTIRNYRSEISHETYYRKDLILNKFPSIYNAITYFNRSYNSERFFGLVREIFENWDHYKNEFKLNGDSNTDVVYSLASFIMGEDITTDLRLSDISMVHMKPKINNTTLNDWTIELSYDLVRDNKNIFRIDNYTQLYPVHYYIKEFSDVLNRELYG